MHSLIRERTRFNNYDTVSEYIRYLVRRDKTSATEPKVYPPQKTANECIEEARLWLNAERAAEQMLDREGPDDTLSP